jgi:type IX secretion system PorP/SprF family membrane protein
LKSRNYLIALLGFVCFVTTVHLSAQDIHYTQFYNSPININPALTGIYNGDQRYMGSVRDQWRSVPVPWFTFSGSYDQKIYLDKHEEGFFGVGGIFNYDRQGDSKLNLSGLSLTGSYTRILAPEHLLTGGLLLGIASRGFDTGSLTWDNQWNGQRFDANLGSGENFDAQRVTYFESGAGINYRFQKSTRKHIDIGVGAFHLIEPTTTFYNTDDQKLPRRFSISGVANWKLVDALDLQLHALHQIQGAYDETLFGFLTKIYVSQQKGNEWQLHLGGSYRTSNAWVPAVALSWNQWYASFSYDVDTSEFDQFTNGRGGPEFHLRYVITHVKDLKKYKICPIY